MCCHLRLNNKQPVNILNQYWIHLLLKDHYFICIFIPTHFMTSPSSKNLQMSWFSLLVLKFLLCFILKFLLCFTCRNFQSAALFLPVGSFSVLHILTYCTFQFAVVCLPIVPFCTQLYFCLLYISVLVPVSVFLDFNCHTFEWSAVSLPVYRSGGFIHLVRIVTPFGFPTFVSPVLIVWVFYCTVFFISSILN